tara:strand:+ start:319 stop:426 length:108 start_codon:yes stop_codon:yes gene_type:complete
MHHFFNCHGEWLAAMAAMPGLSFVVLWVRTKVKRA